MDSDRGEGGTSRLEDEATETIIDNDLSGR